MPKTIVFAGQTPKVRFVTTGTTPVRVTVLASDKAKTVTLSKSDKELEAA